MVFGLMSTVYTPMKDMETPDYKAAPEVMVLKICILYRAIIDIPKFLGINLRSYDTVTS